MLEGLICGLLGSAIAILLLLIGKAVALPGVLSRLNTNTDVEAWSFPTISLIILLAGLTIGAVGSGLTIRRFLQV
jgi:cell division transport system permease protein